MWSGGAGDAEAFNYNVDLLTKLLGDVLTKGHKASYIPGQKRSRLTGE